MKKKTKPVKDQLIDSLLEDLKDTSDENGLRIGPQGIEASGNFSAVGKESPRIGIAEDENNDKTTLLTGDNSKIEISRPDYGAQFFVSDENKKNPFTVVAQEMKDSKQKKDIIPDISINQFSKRTETKAPGDAPAHPQQKVVAEKENKFVRAENSKLAQERILELEQEIERCQKENEMIISAHELAKNKLEELLGKNMQLEKQRNEFKEVSESELKIFRDGLQSKDNEIARLKSKVEELELRFSNDLRKVRVRERDLETRLELAKAEKVALLKSKDDTILELKRRQESLQGEIEMYQRRILDLSHKIDVNQEQFARTVRALRLALTNLEVNEETTTIAPVIKKAE